LEAYCLNLQLKMKSKALLLLLIFLLNTVVGFSCALRMSHHEHDEAAEHHEHHHAASVIVHHDQQHLPDETSISKNDPCCQGAVNNFVSLAKLVPQSGKIIIQSPIVYIGSYSPFSSITLPGVKSVHQTFIDERQWPPTKNIRITIQSFQI
jgi:ABC-type nickel/cobalt efflux system permease component RcnA